jgi:hypothetical protein
MDFGVPSTVDDFERWLEFATGIFFLILVSLSDDPEQSRISVKISRSIAPL